MWPGGRAISGQSNETPQKYFGGTTVRPTFNMATPVKDGPRADATSSPNLPSRLPVLSELGIVLCVGARVPRWLRRFQHEPRAADFLMLCVGCSPRRHCCVSHGRHTGFGRICVRCHAAGHAVCRAGIISTHSRRDPAPRTACAATSRRDCHWNPLCPYCSWRCSHWKPTQRSVFRVCCAVDPVVTLRRPSHPAVKYLDSFWIAIVTTLLMNLRLLTPGSSPHRDAAVASTFGWAVILGLTAGPFALGTPPFWLVIS